MNANVREWKVTQQAASAAWHGFAMVRGIAEGPADLRLPAGMSAANKAEVLLPLFAFIRVHSRFYQEVIA